MKPRPRPVPRKPRVLVRQSALNRAEINLGYTEVKVPVSGRVGRNLVDLGNLVGEGEATVLTEITVQHPMYVYINLNELDLLKVADAFKKRVREKKIDLRKEETKRAGLEVFLGLADEEGYPHKGIVDFAESGLDPDTGTLQMRATFDNSKQPPDLYPGLFGRIRLPIADRQDMPLVADSAVGTDQSGTYLLVVNQKDVVEKRNVDLGQLIDGLRVIEKGLAPEDRIVVNGLQRARPGAQVDPEETRDAIARLIGNDSRTRCGPAGRRFGRRGRGDGFKRRRHRRGHCHRSAREPAVGGRRHDLSFLHCAPHLCRGDFHRDRHRGAGDARCTADRPVSRDHTRPRSRSRRSIPAPMRPSFPKPWRRRSSSRSTASKT